MPSAVTAPIQEEGLSFRQFALRCARLMGACIRMRDESLEEPPRKETIDPYHEKALASAKAELRKLEAMTIEQAKVLRDAEARERDAQRRLSAERSSKLRLRYEGMRTKVEAWAPPSPEHENLKRVMLEQLEQDRIDCEPFDPPEPPSAVEWLAERLRRAREDIEYHGEKLKKEHEAVRSQNVWIEQLYASLPKE